MKKRYKYFKKLSEAKKCVIAKGGVIHKIDKKYKMKSKYAVYW